MSKDPAAIALGKKRWKGVSEEEKAAHVEMMHTERQAKMTPEERSESARKAVQARWAKAKKAAKKAGKKTSNA
jgi:hypothetical protein